MRILSKKKAGKSSKVFFAIDYKDERKLTDKKTRKSVEKKLEKVGAEEVYFNRLDGAEITAFAQWPENEISNKVKAIKDSIPEAEVVDTEVLTPSE